MRDALAFAEPMAGAVPERPAVIPGELETGGLFAPGGGCAGLPKFTPLAGLFVETGFDSAGFDSGGGVTDGEPGIFNCPPSDCRGRAAGGCGRGGPEGFGFDPGDGVPGLFGGLAIPRRVFSF
jgi:hypothetical protein